MAKTQFWWVLLPYVFVYVGMTALQSAWGALIGFHISLLPVIILNRKTVYSKLIVPVSRLLLLVVAVSGLSAGSILMVILPYTGLLPEFASRVAALGLSGVIWLPFILYFTLINPWLEEAYWRIVLFSPSRYLAPVDFMFAGYHLIILNLFVGISWMVLAFIILVLAGWFWRQISHYTGSLVPAVFAHMLADLSVLLVLYHYSV